MKQAKVIKGGTVALQRKGAISIRELFNTTDFPRLSVNLIELNGQNQSVTNIVSDMFYYVIEGTGTFLIDKQAHQVESGDLVVIPKGSKYQDSGQMKLLAIASPRFDPKGINFHNS